MRELVGGCGGLRFDVFEHGVKLNENSIIQNLFSSVFDFRFRTKSRKI
jgi:hypothetical protein